MREILIRGADVVVTMDAARRELAGADVLIRGGVIAAVGADLARKPELCGTGPGLRREVVEALKAKGVGTQVHYIPVHTQPYYRERYGALDLPGATAWYDRCLSLPLYPGMADEDVDRVVEALTEVLRS